MFKHLYIFLTILFISSMYGQNSTDWMVFNTSNSGIPENSISSIDFDRDNIKWIGFNVYGVAEFNDIIWIHYNVWYLPHWKVTSIEIDKNNNKWIGTIDGLVKYDGTNWHTFTRFNSGLPNESIKSISVDSGNNIWIGTGGGGFAKYSGSTWQVFNVSNSGLPHDWIWAADIDSSNSKWIGTNEGLAKFHDNIWTIYNTSNSGIPGNQIYSVCADNDDNVWVGTVWNGLGKFDGSNWTVFDTTNSGLPYHRVTSIAADDNGDMWFGTEFGGLAKFDGEIWTVYTKNNSPLPLNYINAVAIDDSGNKWIGTSNGLAVYRKGGVLINKINDNPIETSMPMHYELDQNYPNPFNSTTRIHYSISHPGNINIEIFDVSGKKIKSLINQYRSVGSYSVLWNGKDDKGIFVPSGLYFYILKTGEGYHDQKKMLLIR